MSKRTTTRKRVKAVRRQDPLEDIAFGKTVDNPADWDLDFKIKENYQLTPTQVELTYIAVLAALKLLQRRQVDNIIYIRSIVESASRSMGALPGELEEKFAPWSMPLIDKLEEVLSGGVGANLMSKGYIKCIPVNFTRGLTFKNSCVIIDEAQNMTTSELTTILTRFGVDSKYVVVGDTYQADIGVKSGFKRICKAFNTPSSDEWGIETFNFTSDDIVRSEVLRFIVDRLGTIK